MDIYKNLLRWAKDKGVVLNGIEPRKLPNRGIGIVATKPLQENDVLLQVPTSALRTPETVPKRIAKKLPHDMRIHGLLAADLALDTATPSPHAAWNAVLPTREDVRATMPLTWDARLTVHFPPTARALLAKQAAKFARDWALAQTAFPSAAAAQPTHDEYMYAWVLVNTRTFYYESARSKAMLRSRDDRMVMQPVADLFNHTDDARSAAVQFDAAAFTVTARREYAAGDEVCISYGRHSNDFLLAEYGFVLAHNRWDEACLDDAVLPRLSRRQRELLDEVGFLGNYMLDASTVCYRTQVALRLLCVPLPVWRSYVDGAADGGGGGAGAGDEDAQQDEVDALLVEILREYSERIEDTLETVEAMDDVGQAGHREMLCMRWRQIRRLVDSTIEGLAV
ncbi:hypothetical protein B0T22DRAFT_496444 [Podospora appendiculata]|uniref:SET domain-containing protein n=1 Tax=Podospora appendiculata TaxID=314037 RepID=A0AAE1CGT6_9PEZI|nr:hypothetical protein B0T22DRAFT_496444 [Podospora appendiculata]